MIGLIFLGCLIYSVLGYTLRDNQHIKTANIYILDKAKVSFNNLKTGLSYGANWTWGFYVDCINDSEINIRKFFNIEKLPKSEKTAIYEAESKKLQTKQNQQNSSKKSKKIKEEKEAEQLAAKQAQENMRKFNEQLKANQKNKKSNKEDQK